ncbi:hypothetical protein Gpo141_00007494 [Globisporangium polare]
MTKLRNRTVLLTGCSSPLGYSFAVQFAQRGANLVLWDADVRLAQRVASEITRLYGVVVSAYQVDLHEQEQVYAGARHVALDVLNVSIVVNTCDVLGGAQHGQLLVEKSDDKEIADLFRLHALGSLWLVKALLPQMLENKQGGRFAFLSSSVTLVGSTRGLVDYAASKFAILGMARALDYELLRLAQANNTPAIQVTTVLAPLEYSKLVATQLSAVAAARKVERGWMKPDLIATKTILALKRNKRELVLPAELRFVHALCVLLPQAWGDKLLDQLKYSRASACIK